MCWPISSLLHLTWGVWDPLMFNHINVPNSLSATQIPSPRYPLVDDFSREHLPNLTKGRNPMESFLYLSIKLVIHMDCIRVDISHLHQCTYRFTKQRKKKMARLISIQNMFLFICIFRSESENLRSVKTEAFFCFFFLKAQFL